MARVYRSPLWPLVAVLVGLYLAHDLGAKQAFQQSTSFVAVPTLRVEYIPDPKDIVNLAEGAPYTVPADKVLIITDWTVAGLGDYATSMLPYVSATANPRVLVDGTPVWGAGFCSQPANGNYGYSNSGGGSGSGRLFCGVRAVAGQTVTLQSGANYLSPKMFASGFLAKAN